MIRVTEVRREKGGGRLRAAARDSVRAWPERHGLIVSLRDDQGHLGLGEASPLPGYSPDTLESCVRALESSSLCRELPETILEAFECLGRSADFSRVPALRCALETAVLDLIGQRLGAPGWSLLKTASGLGDPGVPHSLAALVTSPDPLEAAAEAQTAIAAGLCTVKLKVGGATLEHDIHRVEAVVSATRPKGRVRVDANRAWAPSEAARMLSYLEPFEIEFVEEPVSDGRWEKLPPVSVPLGADESLQRRQPDCVAELAERGVGVFVLKPMVLGLSGALAIGTTARRLGLDVVVSHAFEGPIGFAASAALAFAVGSPGLASGLGPHPGLSAWPGLRPLALAGHHLAAPSGPGLGIEVFCAAYEGRR